MDITSLANMDTTTLTTRVIITIIGESLALIFFGFHLLFKLPIKIETLNDKINKLSTEREKDLSDIRLLQNNATSINVNLENFTKNFEEHKNEIKEINKEMTKVLQTNTLAINSLESTLKQMRNFYSQHNEHNDK